MNKEVQKIFASLNFTENEGKAYYVLLQKKACFPNSYRQHIYTARIQHY